MFSIRKTHVFDGPVVHLEEQNGACSMTFRNRFPESFFTVFSSIWGPFWESCWKLLGIDFRSAFGWIFGLDLGGSGGSRI